jgi:hypothetical protein
LRPDWPEPQTVLTVGGREFSIARARLGGFLRIQVLLGAVSKAAKTKDTGSICEAVFSFLHTALGMDRATFETAPWFEVCQAYAQAVKANLLPEAESLAMLKFAEKANPVPWDYDARPMVTWLHSLAEAYGWTKDEVLELWPEEAVALLQEIEAADFSRREFDHMHSELSYKFDKRGKGTYQPLRKPAWMVFRVKRPMTRMAKASLPVGNVIYKDGLGPEVKEQEP